MSSLSTNAAPAAEAAGAGASSTSYRFDDEQHLLHPNQRLFQAVIDEDYEGLSQLFAVNARNSVVSFMSMKSRWARQHNNHSQHSLHRHRSQDSLGKSGTVEIEWKLMFCDKNEVLYSSGYAIVNSLLSFLCMYLPHCCLVNSYNHSLTHSISKLFYNNRGEVG